MARLEVEDLWVAFDAVPVVRGVSLAVEHGEILALVGESGSGKTMTARALMRLVPPPGVMTAGRLRLEDVDILGLDPAGLRSVRGHRMSMVFQDPMSSLNPGLTIGQQIVQVLRAHTDIRPAAARQRAVDLLRQVGLPTPAGQFGRYPHELSGGMRQRVMLAMAVACGPDILIADEPTTALDVTLQAQILELILALRDSTGMAMVLITHDLGIVARVADRVSVMYAGEIVETGTVDELFATPRHPYTQALLRSVPALTGERRRLAVISGNPISPADVGSGCAFAGRCPHVHDVCRSAAPRLGPATAGQRWACWLTDPEPNREARRVHHG